MGRTEGIVSETNYQRYFGTPEKASEIVSKLCKAVKDCDYCPFWKEKTCPECALENTREWMETEAE
jgi:hypothetical protein